WLVPMMCDRDSDFASTAEFPVITKKVRDEPLGTFRRCGYWMSVKVLLQLNLTIEYGKSTGRFIYKLIMLKFLSQFSELYDNDQIDSLDIDVMNQMMAKMARRIEKLEQSFETSKNLKKFSTLYHSVIDDAKITIKKIRRKIDKQLEKVKVDDVHNAQLNPLTNLNFEKDVVQSVPKLRKYLKQRKRNESLEEDISPSYTTFRRHRSKSKQMPSRNLSLRDEAALNLYLTDFENWFLYEISLHVAMQSFSSAELRDEYFWYYSEAAVFYKDDPLGSSKMILCLSKFLVILDMIAVHRHPLFRKYGVGINEKIFDDLLLPQHIDMEIAFQLQEYLHTRNSYASGKALIEETNATEESFAVHFAAANHTMREVKEKICLKMEEDIAAKREEWLTERERVAEMRKKINLMSCDYYTDHDGKQRHCIYCGRCTLESENKSIKINLYEQILPTEDYKKYAVVFELLIPIEISCLRDVLYQTATLISEPAGRYFRFYNWVDYAEISSLNESSCHRVTLGSSRLRNLSQRKAIKSLHVDHNFEEFIIENGFDCTYSAMGSKLPTKIMEQSANQSICSIELTLAEYKNFGSLRADGHRLQLRKLYAMIATEALSFETSSVLALVLQTIWETGPVGECLYHRESHEDFLEESFASEMIEMLYKFIEKLRYNWKHPRKLILASLLAVRLFDLNLSETFIDSVVKILQKLRNVSIDWMRKIQASIDESDADAIQAINLRNKLVDTAIGGAMTFFVHSKHKWFEKIFIQSADFSAMRTWLEYVVLINNNVLMHSTLTDMAINRRNLLRIVRNVGIHLEYKLQELIDGSPNDVLDFIHSQWVKAECTKFGRISFSENHLQTMIVNDGRNCITIDIVTGEFKVNNAPIARLPSKITNNKEFRRVFDAFNFEVQPDQSNCYSTKQKYKDYNYDFRLVSKKNVVITEIRANNIEYELIPHEVLMKDIPHLLVENFSHWWHKHKNVIEIRPKSFIDNNFAASDGLIRLECKDYIHILMDSPKIAKIEFIRMRLSFWVDMSEPHIRQVDIKSNEFNGMRVSLQQKHGTLFGLNHGLYLESVCSDGSSNRMEILLLPHGEISLSANKYHTTIEVMTKGTLANPPYFAYRVDEFCKQLTPTANTFSSWFYLAYLYAISSLGAPDSFTGLTGTERSLQILTSAFVWSSAPFDTESDKILQLIVKLSPIRKFNIKKLFKEIHWPKGLNTHASHDSFILIAVKLMADSLRLNGLHFQQNETEILTDSDVELNRIEYLRSLSLYPNLRVVDAFVKSTPLMTEQGYFHESDEDSDRFLVNTWKVSILHHENAFNVTNFELYDFLINGDELYGNALEEKVLEMLYPESVLQSVESENRHTWIPLYEIARKRKFNEEEFALLWSLMAHNGYNVKAILALQLIAQNANSFDSKPPNVSKYDVSSLKIDPEKIRSIFYNYHNFPFDFYERDDRSQEKYRRQCKQNIDKLTEAVLEMFPCDAVNSTIYRYSATDIKIRSAVSDINRCLLSWNNNRKLLLFITDVTNTLNILKAGSKPIGNLIAWSDLNRPIAPTWEKFSIDFNAKMCQRIDDFVDEIDEAAKIYVERNFDIESKRSACQWWNILFGMVQPWTVEHLIDAQIYPRFVKSLVLPKLLSSDIRDELKWVIGAFAVTLAHEQRADRIRSYENQPQMIAALQLERENEPHSNWFPVEYPEWLLFEIEQNLSVRRIQIEIAKRMIFPPKTHTAHSVMQLNMGEGKTAVIVPIVASILSDGCQICQITVLKSLYASNSKSLRQYLGGMLNRRIYSFPCRLDMPIDKYAQQLLMIYEECKRNRGVILTLPEYRLSFQLKIYEMASKGFSLSAKHLLHAHKWINKNVRNILDESDAILHAKYQLIYTIGDQQPLDGGSLRWNVIQGLLRRVPHHMKLLYEKYGNEKVEFDVNYLKKASIYGADIVAERSDVFTACRILDASIYQELKSALIDDFLDGNINIMFSELVFATKSVIKMLLSDKEYDKRLFDAEIAKFPQDKQHILLTMSGLLRFEVLRLVMTKRWRVNYGVYEGFRKMAIPFKAKDVAAEMTEFGHLDVALCLTHLSYYYSGLTDQQLREAFKILENKPNPTETYESWILSIPELLVDESIKYYSGINLNNSKQLELLFPLLRHNMDVIDYWLSNAVLPREAKTFQQKLMCTAWDLCSEHMGHTVTGFSGTNDTKNILPLTITQNDLPELEQTNENVRQTLVHPENQAYEHLPENVGAIEILKQLAERKIPVLLDSGALILELKSHEVAEEWLKLVPPEEFDAAIYFDQRDVLMTRDRDGIVCEFDCSLYRRRMDRCIVYLDEIHTRGTDLKFPIDWKACVTLSREITRDKTVQACMRMRLLGRGHSIAFWASFDADVRIRENCGIARGAEPTNEDIIKFICCNSERQEKENTIHWAAAGFNYAKKLSAHKKYELSDEVDALSRNCFDHEITTLKEMYGGKQRFLVSDLSESRFENLESLYQSSPAIIEFISKIKTNVDKKIRAHISNVERYSGLLDEEQEKELEHELEEIRQIECPPPAKPETPYVHPLLKQLIQFGTKHHSFDHLKQSVDIRHVSIAMQNTKVFDLIRGDESAWSDHIYVTGDFVKVIRSESQSLDDYLRPNWWIARIDSLSSKYIILLLSSFEIEELLPIFRESKNAVLFMYRVRNSKFHENLLSNQRVCVTAMLKIDEFNLADEVEINVISGAQYFRNDREQESYCHFLGLIPRPRLDAFLLQAFDNGIIELNGFVQPANRLNSEAISRCVGRSNFKLNPVAMVIKIIETHHEFVRVKSHVGSILMRGFKMNVEEDHIII
ncbi:hypothetical protein Bhyg_01377, partial [Pseudolycoriella hygida]